MTTLENGQKFECPRCGGALIKASVKKYNKVDLIGALVVGIFVFSLPTYFIVTDTSRPNRWPMAIIAFALAIGYALKIFVSYEIVEVIKCKYCGKNYRGPTSNV